MGITRLMHLLREKCPEAIKQIDLKSYTGRQVACDASVVINYYITPVYLSVFNINTAHC
jgi:hypothetical protein